MTGLRFFPRDWREAALTCAFAVFAVAVFVVLLDCGPFGRHLSASYVAFYTSPLLPRLPVMCLKAMLEEVVYRGVLMTACALVLAAVWRRPPPGAAMVLIIIGTQAANVGAVVLADPLYGTWRYLAVGCVWGWLYWRHGWVSALVGHASVHLVLDPLLKIGLA